MGCAAAKCSFLLQLLLGGGSGEREGKEVKEGSGLGDKILEALEGLFRGRVRLFVLLLLLEVSEVCEDDLLGMFWLSSGMLRGCHGR